ncbi:MAG: hypothetical protein B6244_00655 [Candidatus Cloacimonetes bacterium 4572_55]|nr:MAG: hypothetical protein B6244_00655 [Candidatus Cloacimonetes bacterium 4572_55]
MIQETSKYLRSLGVIRPTVILDKPQILRNIKKMAQKARISGVKFRPHFKTHQSHTIGDWFRECGARAISVSSLDMAQYFTDRGWRDITIALLANILEIDKINVLSSTIRLNLIVDSMAMVQALHAGLKYPVKIWLKIDVGYERTGATWDDTQTIVSIAKAVLHYPKMHFVGLLAHSGQSYRARSTEQVRQVYNQTVKRMRFVRKILHGYGVKKCKISVGDTPTCSVIENLSAVDEIRPGNFVFNDLMQEQIGSCQPNEIAIGVACPVIGKYAQRQQIVIIGGAVHLSKEYIVDRQGKRLFGYITDLEGDSLGSIYKTTPVRTLSQEHGCIQIDDRDLFDQIEVGNLILISPVHSCLTCNLFTKYKTLQGEIISRLY